MKRSLLSTGAAALVLAAALPAGAAISGHLDRSEPSLAPAGAAGAVETTAPPSSAPEATRPEPTRPAPAPERPATTELARPEPRPEPTPVPAAVRPVETRPENRPELAIRLECGARSADSAAVVHCAWKTSADADLIGYRVWRIAPESAREVIGRTERHEYVDRTVETGHRYTYAVEAVGRDGGSHGLSNTVQVAVAAPTRPQAMRLGCALRAAEAERAVVCEWSAVDAPALRGYQLWRSVDNGARELVASVGREGVRRYVDTAIRPGQAIEYRVIALDGDGNQLGAGEIARVRVPGGEPIPTTTVRPAEATPVRK